MPLVISQLAVDAADPAAQARWWREVLGGTIDDADPDEVAVTFDTGLPELLFLRVPETKTVKNRLHLDVRPPDGSSQDTELARLLAHGARRVDVGQGPDVPWIVMADPEGNEFCLLRMTPAQVAAERAAAAG
jgi:Glyoxalase-like domain